MEAKEQIELLVEQMAERQGVTEKLKAEDQVKGGFEAACFNRVKL